MSDAVIGFEEWQSALNDALSFPAARMVADADWLRIKEFACVYRISPKHCYDLVRDGRLPAIKIPGIGWRINRRVFADELSGAVRRRRVGDVPLRIRVPGGAP